ncbi:DNA polymerase III subunit gamma/tau, partial [Myxococcota bacterium]|nr:DNA polymerase III subunit gamma/tau [Myxococcota bacterium]
MSYVVLARKWRPQLFSDVLGQDHVTRTLTNAINASRIAHAFLFSGPRGVGKTSAARILAKALCCEAQPGPTATPCGTCRQCTEITEGRSTDVFEIDAASHTGVDNVREIIDNVRYLPSSARFKIYVIDEVHMLSTGAFNALLKTLEEPPLHVKFILATTDVHKVPVTILSRCQRYDFRRIPLVEIAERLSKILGREGIDHDPSALTLVAREAEGSMRDAQSLLEQILAFADGRRLDGPLVRESLGVVDGALIARTFDALFAREPGALIEIASAVHERGLDLKRFADALVEEARDLLVAKLVPEPSAVLDRPSDEVRALVERAKGLDTVSLERLFDRLSKLVEEVSRSPHPRFALEIGLASLAEQPERVPVEALLAKLERVERELLATAPQANSNVRRSNDWRGKGPPAQYAARVRAEVRRELGAPSARTLEPRARAEVSPV